MAETRFGKRRVDMDQVTEITVDQKGDVFLQMQGAHTTPDGLRRGEIHLRGVAARAAVKWLEENLGLPSPHAANAQLEPAHPS